MSAMVSRRDALAGFVALSGASIPSAPATASPEADRVLLDVVRRALHENALSDSLMAPWQDEGAGPEPDAVWEASHRHAERFVRLRGEAATIPAMSLAGLRAKARLVLSDLPDRPYGGVDAEHSDAIVWSLCRDLLALTGGEA
ncbi:hypothetical protein [Brytella acorum]|uniref:Uncharacterized protein n=1 Tax=Brytella acorum TaxID=2959299 RepID=A0AA35V825_9PROT|nr:hypothetical protein [Brytella acorum]MDF3625708.1 hypothetical protein [Brytella acorum]CAI9121337.1 hypothetical protein LMG32879_002184 [Brytella acorum]